MKITTKPTGNLIQGHVLDSAKQPLQQALKDYDPYLYLTWNSKKLHGWGCWEVRRRPEMKSVREEDIVVYGGNTYVCPQYNEMSLINHVMDVPFINQDVLKKISKMDTWQHSYKGKDFLTEVDYCEAKYMEKEEEEAHQAKEYMIKQNKTLIRDFMEFTASGGNPYRIADHWGQ